MPKPKATMMIAPKIINNALRINPPAFAKATAGKPSHGKDALRPSSAVADFVRRRPKLATESTLRSRFFSKSVGWAIIIY